MTVQVECPCGRLLRVSDASLGKKARCPFCGAVLAIPGRSTPTPDRELTKDEADNLDVPAQAFSEPPNVQTPALLIYFGLLTAAAILWGTLATWKLQGHTAQMEEAQKRAEAVATWKLQERTAQMEEAQKRAEAAERATKAITDQAEEIKKEATRQAERVKQEADAIMREARVTKLREEEQLHKIYPNLRRIAAGENSVNERYLESFWLSGSSIRVKLTNRTSTPVKPDFSMRLIDKNGMDAGTVHVSWMLTSIEPGETRFDEQSCGSEFGRPVYYTLDFK